MAPLLVAAYDAGGSLAAGTLTQFGTAATTLATAGKLVIWSRPGGNPVRVGSSSLITSGTVPDQVTSLRTRRR
jgi:hypothetical protein